MRGVELAWFLEFGNANDSQAGPLLSRPAVDCSRGLRVLCA